MEDGSFITACGGSIENAVSAVMALVRALWRVHYSCEWVSDHSEAAPPNPALPLSERLAAELRACGLDPVRVGALLISRLEEYSRNDQTKPSQAGHMLRPEFQALTLLRAFIGDYRRPRDLRYFAMRDIRSRYHLGFSAFVARVLSLMVQGTESLLDRDGLCRVTDRDRGLIPRLRMVLQQALASDSEQIARWKMLPEMFLEVCATLGYARPLDQEDSIQFDRAVLSPETLLSHIFGLPTGIDGFDGLFGGGGLILVDEPAPRIAGGDQASDSIGAGGTPIDERTPIASGEAQANDAIGGRTVLLVGPFGSGKSLLTLLFAVEVARKGGAAWVMALEQTVEECLYSLESIGVATQDGSFRITWTVGESLWALSDRGPGNGVLVFLNPGPLKYSEFLAAAQAKFDLLQAYPLRLFVVDPVSAITGRGGDTSELRAQTIAMFREAKRNCVNIWITSERPESGDRNGFFEENIADTVLRMGVQHPHAAYPDRYIEVVKSRLQMEQPGRHTFLIGGRKGLTIFPSSAAINARVEPWRPVAGSGNSLGIPGMDDVLGPGGIEAGDVIVFHGPTGTSKTLLGLLFLLSPDPESPSSRCSLLASDMAPHQMRSLVKMAQEHTTGPARSEIELCPLMPGYTSSGQILDSIRGKLEECRERGTPVDRLLLTSVSRWLMDMPLLREDPIFAVALLNLVRRFRATTVIVLADSSRPENAALQEFVIDHAECVVHFRRIDFRGQERHVVRVLKTRAMDHRREPWEIVITSTGIRLEPSVSLLRVDPSGAVHPVRIALFLHSETKNHRKYNYRMLGAVRATLSPHARIDRQSQAYDPSLTPLSSSSAIDELQILQLDQFQVPVSLERDGSTPSLTEFSVAGNHDLIDQRLGRLKKQVLRKDGTAFIAIPFYQNISLMSYRKSDFRKGFPGSWKGLADECERWEKKNGSGLFFACHASPSNGFESYNCLFLEILQSLRKRSDDPQEIQSTSATGEAPVCSLLSWLSHPDAADAATWFRILCSRSHVATLEFLAGTSSGKSKIDVESGIYSGAKVWRHWYNTLNQMLSEMKPRERNDVCVQPLYGNVTSAGEWYLGVPAHSAAPELALNVIRVLTAPERELQRMHLGVGLPTREAVYENRQNISPYFNMDPILVKDLVNSAFERSYFSCYQLFSESL